MKTIDTMKIKLINRWDEITEEITEEKVNGEYEKESWTELIESQRQMMNGLVQYVEDEKDLMDSFARMIAVYHFSEIAND